MKKLTLRDGSMKPLHSNTAHYLVYEDRPSTAPATGDPYAPYKGTAPPITVAIQYPAGTVPSATAPIDALSKSADEKNADQQPK